MSSRQVHRVTTGRWRQNCYILDDGAGYALIIDPGAEPERYFEHLRFAELRPLAIINTHAHYDHIGGVSPMMAAYEGLPFYLHGADRALLRQANLYRSLFEASEKIVVPTEFIDFASTGEALTIGNFNIRVIPTPGHTKGSVCFVIDSKLYSGDTLLPSGAGRTDLPGASPAQLKQSLAMLQTLPGDLMMHPGHGDIVRLSDALAKVPLELQV